MIVLMSFQAPKRGKPSSVLVTLLHSPGNVLEVGVLGSVGGGSAGCKPFRVAEGREGWVGLGWAGQQRRSRNLRNGVSPKWGDLGEESLPPLGWWSHWGGGHLSQGTGKPDILPGGGQNCHTCDRSQAVPRI